MSDPKPRSVQIVHALFRMTDAVKAGLCHYGEDHDPVGEMLERGRALLEEARAISPKAFYDARNALDFLESEIRRARETDVPGAAIRKVLEGGRIRTSGEISTALGGSSDWTSPSYKRLVAVLLEEVDAGRVQRIPSRGLGRAHFRLP